MNITFYTMNTDFPDYRSPAVPADRTKAQESSGIANYDKLTINNSKLPSDDASFAQILAREAAGRITGGAGSGQVTRLQQQVSSGAYVPDARRIAEHMLGYRS